MNSKKCKQLRKMFFGSLSKKIRAYKTIDHYEIKTVLGIKIKKLKSTTVINDPESPRAKYQAAKRLYKIRRIGQ